MEVIACSKYVGIVSVFVFVFLYLSWCTLFANAQPGFLSIDCGGEGSYTDPNTTITWVPDDDFIHNLGEKAESYYSYTVKFYLTRLRVFPKPVNKACYELPITPNLPHLLRLSFVKANSSASRGFNYSVETLDMLYMEKVVFDYDNYLVVRSGNILVSADKVVHICLIRTSECDDPLISAIELRLLKAGMYDMAKPGTMLNLIERDDVGGVDNITRYPQDRFDRLWSPWWPPGTNLVNVSKSISISNTKNFPPPSVMRTAVVGITDDSDGIYLSLGKPTTGKAVVLLYFAELNSSETGSFSVRINNVIQKSPVVMKKAFSAIELDFQYDGTRAAMVSLQSDTSYHKPVINAVEMYSLVPTQKTTFRDDVNALREVGKALSLNNWISDPCFGLPWEGIICKNVSNTIRISQINLSGKHLRGLIPPNFRHLTELVSISLDNNYFNGPLPNLLNLFKLEKLNLQNNHLSGELPDWISKLPHLKELDVSNNNFEGVIPPQILHKKFAFYFSGNKHLCPTKRECHDHFPSIALGVAGGIIAIAILVGIIIYRIKFKNACTQPTSLDYLMVNVANSSKSRAFTLEEMTMATKNFTHKIGHGSFGIVYLGKLQDEKQIAVKVLSILSKHGIEQFLNEVDLLSRINHKKLVSYLGFCICNESKDLMLVYEYMSGGSLSDNLYVPQEPKYPQLDWKTRLKIAMDAAQGLEYLHVGCTPKIIHRDVKTSNILLDSNLNGKLADFGLSRMTSNEETSQINTTIKGTPGYLDPTYYKTHMLTDKSDVYSFGVVLFELICGRKPIDTKVSAEKILLTEWVASYAGVDKDGANIEEMVDKRLGKRYNMKSIVHLTNLAWRCIANQPSSRPTISEVVAEIKEAVTFEEEYYQVPDEVSVTFTSSFSSSF
ncbi:probable LRR receptor-like serine/threonine-protein kinase At5g48740 isoform X2 [Cryptomeria japonica]|uniref:probable LRR receptor-like serine/threonine-protein kinase At5g48740 isoform X2 n=1 Tax=Cryptomeria japonica TaxID=3369 RepID=UPI0027D9F0B5|nr:probable LRR receptor-like serine/threonine-protein kinase At5g48740 isoform X2 [Cryptomeria japonica]